MLLTPQTNEAQGLLGGRDGGYETDKGVIMLYKSSGNVLPENKEALMNLFWARRLDEGCSSSVLHSFFNSFFPIFKFFFFFCQFVFEYVL